MRHFSECQKKLRAKLETYEHLDDAPTPFPPCLENKNAVRCKPVSPLSGPCRHAEARADDWSHSTPAARGLTCIGNCGQPIWKPKNFLGLQSWVCKFRVGWVNKYHHSFLISTFPFNRHKQPTQNSGPGETPAAVGAPSWRGHVPAGREGKTPGEHCRGIAGVSTGARGLQCMNVISKCLCSVNS